MGPLVEPDIGPPPEGWAAFFAHNAEVLMRAAARTLGSPAGANTAEEIVDEAFAKLIRHGIPRGRNARAYAIITVQNAARDELRRLGRYTDEDIIFDDLVGVTGIEDDVDDQLLTDQVLAAIDELPEREAYAIREKFVNERPWREVAADLGITTSQGLGKIVKAGLDRLRRMPRFAELTKNVSISRDPSTTTGKPTGSAL
jgi:RNA polymerase sigma factor (sigma-70 family)